MRLKVLNAICEDAMVVDRDGELLLQAVEMRSSTCSASVNGLVACERFALSVIPSTSGLDPEPDSAGFAHQSCFLMFHHHCADVVYP